MGLAFPFIYGSVIVAQQLKLHRLRHHFNSYVFSTLKNSSSRNRLNSQSNSIQESQRWNEGGFVSSNLSRKTGAEKNFKIWNAQESHESENGLVISTVCQFLISSYLSLRPHVFSPSCAPENGMVSLRNNLQIQVSQKTSWHEPSIQGSP